MNFNKIIQFPRANYHVDVGWKYLKGHLARWDERDMGSPLILNPEWQRGHVWTEAQKIAYVEYMLKGGTTGKELYFNCSSWGNQYNTPIYCVDGLQRITSVVEFMDGDLKAFGHRFQEFEGVFFDRTFSINMLKIKNKRELLQIYYDFNSGGTPHSPSEIERIGKMIEDTDPNDTL